MDLEAPASDGQPLLDTGQRPLAPTGRRGMAQPQGAESHLGSRVDLSEGPYTDSPDVCRAGGDTLPPAQQTAPLSELQLEGLASGTADSGRDASALSAGPL